VSHNFGATAATLHPLRGRAKSSLRRGPLCCRRSRRCAARRRGAARPSECPLEQRYRYGRTAHSLGGRHSRWHAAINLKRDRTRLMDATHVRSRHAHPLPFSAPHPSSATRLTPPASPVPPRRRNPQVITDPATGRPKGYGFVRFSSEADRDRALEMQGFNLGGRPIRVSLATARRSGAAGSGGSGSGAAGAAPHPAELDPTNTTLFIGGLSGGVSEEQLRALFGQYGVIVYVKVPAGKGGRRQGLFAPRGGAPPSSTAARRRGGRAAAAPAGRAQHGTMIRWHADLAGPSCSRSPRPAACAAATPVPSARRADRSPPRPRPRPVRAPGCGFVQYVERPAAEVAMASLNGQVRRGRTHSHLGSRRQATARRRTLAGAGGAARGPSKARGSLAGSLPRNTPPRRNERPTPATRLALEMPRCQEQARRFFSSAEPRLAARRHKVPHATDALALARIFGPSPTDGPVW
jgi:RNA recognition motif-containing protein